eukprot:TRINITY_DN11741_c0_g1_i1.p1 TRINITY_DN11741_c0_g1~~TRINITY_DN11741_c0_g1_i1.p1  ORF type:complete len:425 (-),score=101.57 TRINITY_DN11741_c0_g1_i1:13-1266(-)
MDIDVDLLKKSEKKRRRQSEEKVPVAPFKKRRLAQGDTPPSKHVQEKEVDELFEDYSGLSSSDDSFVVDDEPKTRRSSRRRKEVTYEESDEDDIFFKSGLSDPVAEAESAVRAGFPISEMADFEKEFFPYHAEKFQSRYIGLRNLILHNWKMNVFEFLTLEKIKNSVKPEFHEEVATIWEFLMRHGHINAFIPDNNKRMVPLNKKKRIVIIGAGTCGVTCGQQLTQFGYDVVILEGNDRIGGRVRSDNRFGVTVDMGAAILTGLIGNPLDDIYQQTDAHGQKIGSKAHLKTVTGETIDKETDILMDTMFNGLLNSAAQLKRLDGVDESLGVKMRSIIPNLSERDLSVLHWYFANLEYACAADLDLLSLKHWDQDDPHDFSGDHLLMTRGYVELISAIADGLDIRLNTPVSKVNFFAD